MLIDTNDLYFSAVAQDLYLVIIADMFYGEHTPGVYLSCDIDRLLFTDAVWPGLDQCGQRKHDDKK